MCLEEEMNMPCTKTSTSMLSSSSYEHIINKTSLIAHIDRMFSLDLLPNDRDILNMCQRTSGITETAFGLGEKSFRVFDVGGSLSERRKWVHVYEDCHTLVFVASLSGYDENLVEDRTAVSDNFVDLTASTHDWSILRLTCTL